MNRTPGYLALMDEIRVQDFSDPYATSGGILFGLAATAYAEYGVVLPDFSPGAVTVGKILTDYPDGIFQELVWAGVVDLPDIQAAYRVMRLYDALIPADRRY